MFSGDFRTVGLILPLIIWLVIGILLPVIVGFFVGWKKILYWGAGNWLLILIGLIMYYIFGRSLADMIAGMLKIDYFTKSELTEVCVGITGVVIYLITLILGNLLILLPCYFFVYKRFMHIRRKDKIPTDYTFLRDKMRAPYFWINHLTGAAIGIIGFLPSSAILTSMTTAVSTTNYQMNTSSKKSLVAFNRDMLNLGQAFGYWDNPVDLIDSIYGAYQLEKDNNFSNLFDVFKESFELNNIEASGTVDQYKTALQDKILDISNGYQITWNGGIASSTNNRTALQCCSINLRVNNLVVNYIKDKLIDDTVDISSKAIDNVLDFFSKLFSGLPNQSFEVHFDGDTFPDGTDVTINFNGIYLLKVQISNDFYSGLVDVINKDFFGNKFTTQYPNPGKTFIDYFFYPGLKNTNIY